MAPLGLWALTSGTHFRNEHAAEPVDRGHLARQHQRGGVKLGQDGGPGDARTGAEPLPGIDGNLRWTGFEKDDLLTGLRRLEGACRWQFARDWRRQRATRVDPERHDFNRHILLCERVEPLVQPVKRRHRSPRRRFAHLATRPGYVELEALMLVAHAGGPSDAARDPRNTICIGAGQPPRWQPGTEGWKR